MFIYKNYKITVDDYNYTLFRKKGLSQWSALSYHDNLYQAIEAIFDREVRKIMKTILIDLNNPEKAGGQKAELLSKLEKLNNEFKEALKCLN